MTERLDRIEAILLATAERQNEINATLQKTQAVLNQTAQQQAQNTDGIDTLLGAVSTNEVGIRALVEKISESNRRFDILRAETIADRAEWRTSFDETQRKSDEDRARWQADFNEMQRKSDEDRARWQADFDEMQQKSDEDRARWQADFNTQQEVMQRLLLEIRSTNGAVAGLSDRINGLEAS